MGKAIVKNISLNKESREIIVTISAEGSDYVAEQKNYGFPSLLNSAPLVEGFNYVLEFGYAALNAMNGNGDFAALVNENRALKSNKVSSPLVVRVRQFLSSLNYADLSNFQAKCVLLLEKELQAKNL